MVSRLVTVGVLLAGTLASVEAQWLNHPAPEIPRTRDGKPNLFAPAPRASDRKPDLSGIWEVERPKPGEIERLFSDVPELAQSVPGDDLRENHRYFLNVLADFKPGEVSVRPEAGAKNNNVSSPPCEPPSLPSVYFPLPFRIVQTPRLLVILYEGDHTFRQIHMDGRKLPVDPQPSWLGYSIGRWEGRTLIVETAGFNDRAALDIFQHPRSESLRMTERFVRRDFGHLEVELTIDDPKTYSRPFTIRFNAVLTPDTDLLEYFGTENERDQVHLDKAK